MFLSKFREAQIRKQERIMTLNSIRIALEDLDFSSMSGEDVRKLLIETYKIGTQVTAMKDLYSFT